MLPGSLLPESITEFLAIYWSEWIFLFTLFSDVLARIVVAANDKLRDDRQFLRGKAKCLLGYVERYAFHLDEDASRSHGRNKPLGVTFTFTHANLGRLLRDGLVGEDADPYLTLTLHVARHGDTGGLDLAACNPLRFEGLDAERPEGKLVASLGLTFHAAFLRTAVSGLLRL